MEMKKSPTENTSSNNRWRPLSEPCAGGGQNVLDDPHGVERAVKKAKRYIDVILGYPSSAETATSSGKAQTTDTIR